MIISKVFTNEEISKPEIFDVMCAMRSFENVDEENTEERLQNYVCELAFQYMTNMDIVSAAFKQKGKEERLWIG
jgi:hypothetical protein